MNAIATGPSVSAPKLMLSIQSLSKASFQPYGEVIEAGAEARRLTINEGSAERYDDLANVDVGGPGARVLVSIFRARARQLPLELRLIERHLLGSQAFMPLTSCSFLVVVAPRGPAPQAQDLCCFLAQAGQGINFARGTWHHPLIALSDADFLVIDRGSPDGAPDCEELDVTSWRAWVEAPER